MNSTDLKDSILLLAEVTSTILFLSILLYALHYFIKRRIKGLPDDQYFWQKAVLSSLYKPMSSVLILWGLSMIAQFSLQRYQLNVLKFAVNFRQIGIIISLTWFMLLMIKQLEHYITKMGKISADFADRSTADIIGKLLYGTVLTIATVVVLQSSGISVDGILTLGGLGGAALTFAGRDFLANLFGTLSLYLDKPFDIGDKIKIGVDKGTAVEGVVEKITWRSTKLRSDDQKPIHVPNIQFSLVAIENISRSKGDKLKGQIDIPCPTPEEMSGILVKLQDNLEKNFNNVELEIVSCSRNIITLKFALLTHHSTKKKETKRQLTLSVYQAIAKASNVFNIRLDSK